MSAGPETIGLGVNGGTPGSDSNTYVLFDSTLLSVGWIWSHSINRIEFTVQNSQAGTLNAYWSKDGGVTWNEYDTRAVAIPASNTSSGPFDYLVDPYKDWKLAWVNGGVSQATWITQLTAIRGYHGAGA